ncbi:MAG: orotate phosphoribosyltransferase [Candidatus Hydrogenedentota bacterium]|nr:MAG: orotate phosphoribosyltransferase [Candidatus Hydrogenedentota bacterium]
MLDIQYDIPNKEVRKWASICHLSAFSGLILPLGNIWVPLTIWLIKRDEHFYINEQGRQVLNFQLTMTILGVLAGMVIWLLKFIWIGNLLLWIPVVIFISQILLSIVGAIRAWDGEKFRYPFSFPFIGIVDSNSNE